MTKKARRALSRIFTSCAVVSTSVVLPACALIFDFSGYDTTEPAHDGSLVVVPTEVEAGTFDLVAPDALTVTPGTTAHLALTIARHTDGNDRVIVSVAATPAGIAPILATSIDPDASSAVLDLQVFASTPPQVVPLRVVATEGTETQTRDVLVTLRGPSCSPDLGFGGDGNGIVYVLDSSNTDSLEEGVYITAVGEGFIAVTVLPGDSGNIIFYDENGNINFGSNDFNLGPTAYTPDGDGGIFVAFGNDVVHFVSGGGIDDEHFGTKFGVDLPAPSVLAIAPFAALTTLGADDEGWTIEAVDLDGEPLFTEGAPVAINSTANLRPTSLVLSGAGLFACGTLTDGGSTQAAYSRWALDGAADPSFGASDLVTLAPGTSVADCTADDAGIVAVGSRGGDLVLFSVRADGTVDRSFGEGGTVTMLVDAGDTSSARIVTSSDGVVVLSGGGPPDAGALARYGRSTGQLDPSFGDAGRCPLVPFHLGVASAIAVTSEGKLLILSSDYGESIVGRLWP